MNLKDMIPINLADISILIVDDEPKIQNLLSKYFAKAKYDERKIVFASDGKEALQKLQNQPFQLIVMDVVMPKFNGLQVIKEIKKEAKTKNIPVLLISGNLHTEIVKQAIIMGVNNILAKPFNYEVFMERVSRSLSPDY